MSNHYAHCDTDMVKPRKQYERGLDPTFTCVHCGREIEAQTDLTLPN